LEWAIVIKHLNGMHIYNIEKAIPEFIATTLMKSESKMKDQVRKTLITYNYIYTVYDYIVHEAYTYT